MLVMQENGELAGFSDKDKKAYAKVLKEIGKLEPGELCTIQYFVPRNPKFHRLHFAMLKAIFDAQEIFLNPDSLRAWLYIGAGLCDFMAGPDEQMVAIPKSIAWDRMDDNEFSEHHEMLMSFLFDVRCYMQLWPHLSPESAYEMMETQLLEFRI